MNKFSLLCYAALLPVLLWQGCKCDDWSDPDCPNYCVDETDPRCPNQLQARLFAGILEQSLDLSVINF